jgi:hypothetical protein
MQNCGITLIELLALLANDILKALRTAVITICIV